LAKELVKEMLRKIDYEALKSAASDLSIHNLHENPELPANLEECDEIFLRMIHHLLFEIHVINGSLICPQSGEPLFSFLASSSSSRL
jgi:multifunctional methyltransferase subunit TRM112